MENPNPNRNQKVKNPKTKRMIKVGSDTFNQLIEDGYVYDKERNELTIDIVEQMFQSEERYRNIGGFIRRRDLEIDNVIIYRRYDINSTNITEVYEINREQIRNIIHNFIVDMRNMKFKINLEINYKDPIDEHNYDYYDNNPFSVNINENTDIDPIIDKFRDDTQEKSDNKAINKSGLVIKKINFIEIVMFQYVPLQGSAFFETPSYLPGKTVINIKNKDEKCFMYAILCSYMKLILKIDSNGMHFERVSTYKDYLTSLNFNNINWPATQNDYSTFEINNTDYCLYVYGYDIDTGIYSIYTSQNTRKFDITQTNALPILLISDSDLNKSHYFPIINFNPFIRKARNGDHKYLFCYHCLNSYTTEELFTNHLTNCKLNDEDTKTNYKYPDGQYKYKKFTNWSHMQANPFWITLDFEAFNIAVENDQDDSQKTRKIFKQEGNSFAYAVVRAEHYYIDIKNTKNMAYKPKLYKTRLYRGPDMSLKLFEYLDEDVKEIIKLVKYKPRPYLNSPELQEIKNEATKCYICQQEFIRPTDKVIDHCHLSGRVRGICHSTCNTKLRYNKEAKFIVPIIVHNLKNYDSHIIFKSLAGLNKEIDKINIIGINLEKYISFEIGHMRFIDSYQFVARPLADLIQELKNNNSDDLHLANTFPLTTDFFGYDFEKINLTTEKGVYPYEYVNNFEQFNEQLPDKSEFDKNTLGLNEPISQDKYDFAQKVYKKFNCKNFGEYHDIYLYTDVLLLADYWANFCRNSLENYRLDPGHYYTSPGLSWDALFLKTNANIELIPDEEIFNFVESGLRGGISGVGGLRYAKANNPECPDYNPNESNTWINYFDATALYSWAMMQYLPTGNHKFVDVDLDTILNCSDDASTGYLIKCDITVPQELHEYFKDYPPCPEQRIVNVEELSEYQQKLLSDNNIRLAKTEKLMLTLYDKTDYVIHYRLLKKFVSLGIVVKRICQVLSFDQSPWMRQYIETNNDLRKQAQIEKKKSVVELTKLMNNSVFGKTMENVKNRSDVKVYYIKDPGGFEKKKSSIRFVDFKKISDNLVAIHMKPYKIILNKPIFVGQAILDISKELMYDFYYGLKNKYNDNMRLIYTDTDSLILKFQTPNIYHDLLEMKDKFDNTDMKQDYLRDSTNMKVPGKFKDETSGVPIYEVVALKSKMYSYKLSNNKEDRRAKGVKKANVKRDLSHELYKDCLFNSRMDLTVKQYNIESKNHNLGVYEHIKTSLTAFDSKKVNYNILECRPIGFIN